MKVLKWKPAPPVTCDNYKTVAIDLWETRAPRNSNRDAIRKSQLVKGRLNVGPAEKPAPPAKHDLARARVLNHASSALQPFRSAPAPIRSNALPHNGTWEADEPLETRTPAARARLARLRA